MPTKELNPNITTYSILLPGFFFQMGRILMKRQAGGGWGKVMQHEGASPAINILPPDDILGKI